MNFYEYWYYFIYRLFDYFSSRNNFEYRALCLFTTFVFFWVCGINTFYCTYMGVDNILFDMKEVYFSFCVFIFLLNLILFRLGNRHKRKYKEYKETRNDFKDITSLLFSFSSFFVMIMSVLYSQGDL